MIRPVNRLATAHTTLAHHHSEIQDCPYIGAADVNGASRQPTSHQNRRSEAADNTGFCEKTAGDGTHGSTMWVCTHTSAPR